MRYYSGFLFLLFSAFGTLAGSPLLPSLWQQNVRYEIKADLQPENNTVSTEISIVYFNNSPDTLHSIWMHLWPNAFAGNSSAFARQMIDLGLTDFHFYKSGERSEIRMLSFTYPETLIQPDIIYHPTHSDIFELKLNQALYPGERLKIKGSYILKLPKLIDGFGYEKGFFALTNWYPKPAVYSDKGWNLIPYLKQGGFDSEFSDSFIVAITVPDEYTVAGGSGLYTSALATDSKGVKIKRYIYRESNVQDFAWFASPEFRIRELKIALKNADSVVIRIYERGDSNVSVSNQLLSEISASVSELSDRIGNYPYQTFKLILSNSENLSDNFYPGISMYNLRSEKPLFQILARNWFAGMVSIDSRRNHWMDISPGVFFLTKTNNSIVKGASNDLKKDTLFYTTKSRLSEHSAYMNYALAGYYGRSQSLSTPGELLKPYNYRNLLFYKAPAFFAFLNEEIGDSVFDKSIRYFLENHKTKHASPEDLQKCFELHSGTDLNYFFRLMLNDSFETDLKKSESAVIVRSNKGQDSVFKEGFRNRPFNVSGFIPETNYYNNTSVKRLIKVHVPFGKPAYNTLINFDLAPVVGYNLYDGLFAGVYLNHQLFYKRGPQIYFAPFWSFKERKAIGMAGISGRLWRGNSKLNSVIAGVRARKFSLDVSDNMNTYYSINPYLKFDFKCRNNAGGRKTSGLMLDAWHTGLVYSSLRINDSFRINMPTSYFYNYLKATYVYDNHHPVKRKGFNLNLEYGANNKFDPLDHRYLKSWFNAVYKYKYDKGNKYFRSELLAGVFLMRKGNIGRQSFISSSKNGYYDYTYSETLPGRSESSSSNMLVGKQVLSGSMRNVIPLYPTDRWILSLNNDLSLPGILPLRLYLDLSYFSYMSSITSNTGTVFSLSKPDLYYTSGLTVGLYENTLEVFIPLIQSSQFKNYSFWNYGILNSIGFRLNLDKYCPEKLIRAYALSGKWKLQEEL